jgi:tetratricopeptide (TPR) repeat protein
MTVKECRFPVLVAIITIAIVALNACTQDQITAKTAAPVIEQALPEASNLSGRYLAGKFAQHHEDWDAAQIYLNGVLTQDGSNRLLRNKTFLLSLGAGNYAKAKELAGKILAENGSDEASLIFLACDALARDDFAGALDSLQKLSDEGFGTYTKPLLSAWALDGMGKKDEALKLLADSASPQDPTYHIHAGLIEEKSGNMAAAAAHYKIAMANGLTLHNAVLVGNFFTRYGQPEIAETIYASLTKVYPANPFISSLSHQDPKREITPNITRAADGAGIALYELTTMLYEKRAYDSAQVYSGMVKLLIPHSPFVMLMTGDIAAMHKQFHKAVENYSGISKDSPLYLLSKMRTAEVYEMSGEVDQAVNLLTELSQNDATRADAMASIGDIYRSHDNFTEAVKAYDAALASSGPLSPAQWSIIYARGMAFERLNNWPLAEKDLLQALEFQPNNPLILNFIGYSWAKQGVHMDKALSLLHKAVALKPDDGYILDSYGWALYRIGQYGNAVKWIEQSVQQIPDDATILDHLGDAYWQVGRRNEALFKWRRAEELTSDKDFRGTLEGKITNGVPITPIPSSQREAKL